MARKKLYERRVSDIPHRVKLFESTQSYVAMQQKTTGKKQVDIIRELCEMAHQEELTKGQFSIGTTKIFKSSQSKLLKKNINEPLEILTNVVEQLRRDIQDIDINTRFSSDEIYRVLKAFFIENQILVELVHKLEKVVGNKMNLTEFRQGLKAKYESGFETRRDKFFEKYQRTIADFVPTDKTFLDEDDTLEEDQ